MVSQPLGLNQALSGHRLLRRGPLQGGGGHGLRPKVAGQYDASLYRGCHVEPAALVLCGTSLAALLTAALVSLYHPGHVPHLDFMKIDHIIFIYLSYVVDID